MTWHESMERFGVDKPDTRFGLELVDARASASRQPSSAPSRRRRSRASGCRARATMARGALDALIERAKQLGAAGLVWMRVRRTGRARLAGGRSSCRRPSSSASSTRSAPRRATCCCSSRAPRGIVDRVLGQLRLDLGAPAGQRRRPRSSSGSSTSRCSRALDDDGTPDPRAPPVHDAAPRRPRSARRPRRARTCSTCARRRTTSCSTAGSSARAASGSTRSDVQQQIFSLLGISRRAGAVAASGSCSTRSGTARRRTPGSRSASTGSPRCSRARRTSARSSAFPKTQSGADPLTGAPTPARPEPAPRARPAATPEAEALNRRVQSPLSRRAGSDAVSVDQRRRCHTVAGMLGA